MRPPALVPAHVPLATAARIAERHGFVLETVMHEGRVRIAMVRRPRTAAAGSGGASPASPDVAADASGPADSAGDR